MGLFGSLPSTNTLKCGQCAFIVPNLSSHCQRVKERTAARHSHTWRVHWRGFLLCRTNMLMKKICIKWCVVHARYAVAMGTHKGQISSCYLVKWWCDLFKLSHHGNWYNRSNNCGTNGTFYRCVNIVAMEVNKLTIWKWSKFFPMKEKKHQQLNWGVWGLNSLPWIHCEVKQMFSYEREETQQLNWSMWVRFFGSINYWHSHVVLPSLFLALFA